MSEHTAEIDQMPIRCQARCSQYPNCEHDWSAWQALNPSSGPKTPEAALAATGHDSDCLSRADRGLDCRPECSADYYAEERQGIVPERVTKAFEDGFERGYEQCREDVEATHIKARVAVSVASLTLWAGAASGAFAGALTCWLVTR